ncbi:MAG TPA: MXAN_5187 C-terminal domain-containing protein, partial [Candidatus Nanopelagicales bacterium]|nr:MXAN_5187 C-terminal domain-containing protein [Candidatus Nanopelagicales bacterium]
AARPGAAAGGPARTGPANPRAAASAEGESGDLNDQRFRQIYNKYVEAKRAAQESTAGLTYDRLVESLKSQATKLREKNPNKSVDYEVVTRDGKTMLKPILK